MFAPTGIIGVVGGLVLLAGPVSARVWAGPVDMNEACKMAYGDAYMDSRNGNSAYDWSCVDGAGDRKSINVDAYCANKYGNAAYADPQGGGVYDWGCYWR